VEGGIELIQINTGKEKLEHVELFGKPALFTNSRIDRTTVPKGFSCYDLRGSDRDPGKLVTVEIHVAVNHASTVIVPEAILIPKEGFRRLQGKLDFLGECLNLAEFCEEHGLELPPDNRKFTMRAALSEESGLFYTLSSELDAELGTIGHVRIDFGHHGKDFWHTWWTRGDAALNSPEFEAELAELINMLREDGPLKDLNAMSAYCDQHEGQIEGGWWQNYGYIVETEHYRYCLRCNPASGDYQAYLTAYDLRVQEMNRSKQAEQDQQMGGIKFE
jgi:hypothetical protein